MRLYVCVLGDVDVRGQPVGSGSFTMWVPGIEVLKLGDKPLYFLSQIDLCTSIGVQVCTEAKYS